MGWKADANGVLHWVDDPNADLSGQSAAPSHFVDEGDDEGGDGGDEGGDEPRKKDPGDGEGGDGGDNGDGGDGGDGGDNGDGGDQGSDGGDTGGGGDGGDSGGDQGFDGGDSGALNNNVLQDQSDFQDQQVKDWFDQQDQESDRFKSDFDSGARDRQDLSDFSQQQAEHEREQQDLYNWYQEHGIKLTGNENNNLQSAVGELGTNIGSQVGNALGSPQTFDPYQFSPQQPDQGQVPQPTQPAQTPTTSNGSIFATPGPEYNQAGEQPQPAYTEMPQLDLPAIAATTVGTTLGASLPAEAPTPTSQPAQPSPQDVTPGQLASQQTLAAGGTPIQAATAAALASSMVAMDHQTLEQQSSWTKAVYRSTYGDNAEQKWVQDHNAELQRNKALYGTEEPTPGTKPTAGAPPNTPVAPNRTIGAVRPPGPDEYAQYGSEPVARPQPVAAASAAPAAPASSGMPQPSPGSTVPYVPHTPATDTRIPAPGMPQPSPGSTVPYVPHTPATDTRIPGASPAPPLSEQPRDDSRLSPPVSGAIEPITPAESPEGQLVNTHPLDIAATVAAVGDTPVQVARSQVLAILGDTNPNGITDAAQQAVLAPVARVAWYRSVDGKYGPPEAAPREWVSSWIDQYRRGEARNIPFGSELENDIKRAGGTPPSERVAAPEGRLTRVSNIEPMSAAEQMAANYRPAPEPTALNRTPARMGVAGALTGDPIQQAVSSDDPVRSIATLSVGDNASAQDIENITRNVTGAISEMLQGKPEGAYAEPYLNDVARLAWAKEEQAAGRASDPRDAPDSYIEAWKDAFYGSDHSVPFVKELDQRMIDYGVARTPKGQPFNWQVAFGQNGENGLIPNQGEGLARSAGGVNCGPTAFATILRSRGYNANPAQAWTFATSTVDPTTGMRYHPGPGEAFTGADQMVNLLHNQAGLDAKKYGMDWGVVDKELAEGRPVILSGPGHYWVVSGVRDGPNGKEYFAGETSKIVGNSRDGWTRPGAFNYQGAPDTVITAKGDVDPNSNAIKQMSLPIPTGTSRDTRPNLSPSQYAGQRIAEGMTPQKMQEVSGEGETPTPLGAAAGSTARTERANLKPTYTEAETMEMRDRILREAPQIQFDPGDDLDTRIRKAAPTLEWIEREYGVPADALAGMMINESRMGAADAPASRANNLLSLTWMPSDSQSTGYAPGQGSNPRWAAYPSVNSMLARFTGMYAHPDNGHQNLWRNRFSTEKFLDSLPGEGYVVDEPGRGNSVREWRQQVEAGRAKYHQVLGR